MRTDRLALAALASFVMSACTTHSIRDDRARVARLVTERVEVELPDEEPQDWAQDDDVVEGLLGSTLDASAAVRVAILNNRTLRAQLYELGIPRAELVQAGLLPNPTVHAEVRLPEDQLEPEQWDFGISIDLTEVILAPLRADAASARLEAARLRTAGAVVDLAFDARRAFYRYQASLQRLELFRTSMAAFEASITVARQLHAAGNLRDLDLAVHEAAWEQYRIEVAQAELESLDARERLNVVLGLFGQDTSWEAETRLPTPSEEAIDVERLEPRAIEASLELAWLRAEIDATARRAGVARAEGLIPDIEVGFHAEFDGDRWEYGPELQIGIPVFSQGQGRVLAAEAQLDGLRERYVGYAIAIRASVRAARNRALTTELIARRYREVLLPARARVFDSMLLQYNAMQVDVFRLLSSRREQIEASAAYVDALLMYWEARTTLEQVLAGRLAGTISSPDAGAGAMTTRGAGMSTGGSDGGH